MDNKPSYSTQRKASWSIETLLIDGIYFKPFFLKMTLNQNEDGFIFRKLHFFFFPFFFLMERLLKLTHNSNCAVILTYQST